MAKVIIYMTNCSNVYTLNFSSSIPGDFIAGVLSEDSEYIYHYNTETFRMDGRAKFAGPTFANEINPDITINSVRAIAIGVECVNIGSSGKTHYVKFGLQPSNYFTWPQGNDEHTFTQLEKVNMEYNYTLDPSTGNSWATDARPYITIETDLDSKNGGEYPRIECDYMYLEVDYTPAVPSVSSGAGCSCGLCYEILANSITCCASVDDDGGGAITEVGFEYGETQEDMWAVRQVGDDLGTGEFKLPIGPLKPETTYHIRFFATNEKGTTYSNWGTCTTKAAISYGIHNISNTPNICFYISEDEGRTWSIKHGPYNTDQSDIDITKIITQGKGKKRIKFVTDAACSISSSVMCKLDVIARK